jgi:hypothetical protein
MSRKLRLSTLVAVLEAPKKEDYTWYLYRHSPGMSTELKGCHPQVSPRGEALVVAITAEVNPLPYAVETAALPMSQYNQFVSELKDFSRPSQVNSNLLAPRSRQQRRYPAFHPLAA